MSGSRPGARRPYLAPEVVQTSAMDCGPAALSCLLDGFGIAASYDRLRDACQTDVDGTSIDTLEEVAVELGLDAEQVMMPADHVLVAEAHALPALVVVGLPTGATHFQVVWRRHGRFVQIMDPATGRRWLRADRWLRDLYTHEMEVPAEAWREWAGGDEFGAVMVRRLIELGVPAAAARAHLDRAAADPGWQPLADLDAAARLVATLVRAGGARRGAEAAALIDQLAGRDDQTVARHRCVEEAPPDDDGGAQLRFRAAVMMRVRGRTDGAAPAGDHDAEPRPVPRTDVQAALAESPARPGRALWQAMRADGIAVLAALALAVVGVAAGLVIEAVLLRGVLDIAGELATAGQRLAAAAALIGFLAVILVLDVAVVAGALRLGRRVEVRLRTAVLDKLPRLPDRYFRSRLTSDLAERSHMVHNLRALPDLAVRLVRIAAGLVLTTAGLVWLDPAGWPLVVGAALVALAVPLAFQPVLVERDLRVRTHAGALSRFYLDALLGTLPIRTHGAEAAVRRDHEARTVAWARASLRSLRAVVAMETVQSLVGLGLAAAVVAAYLQRGGEPGSVLLLAYWALDLPFLGHQVASLVRAAPRQRNLALRLLEPLTAPDEVREAPADPAPAGDQPAGGVALEFDAVTVRASGHTILDQVTVSIAPGSHVAIVGPSGAGKSSLVGTLLGWHRAAGGQVRVDGRRLDPAGVERLRAVTAWVDPAVQVWNRPLLDNLYYGTDHHRAGPDLDAVLDHAALRGLLERLPDGLQTGLGEGGALVSGGEGQRVRLGRALLRPGVRLAILDEPFRGLDRDSRRRLLDRARTHWRDATLLCVTHDVADTAGFDRVLVVADGRVVADGSPAELTGTGGGPYRSMVEADHAVRSAIWNHGRWRRLWLEGGALAPRQDGDR